MKPILLEISAFGPFATGTVIDFEPFAGNLFLLTGETGAGKTSIFDAISFALYGEASGGRDRRSGRSFRSDFAPAEAKTFVRFTFSQGAGRYTVERSPEFERPKLRGAGTTLSPATALLIEEGTDRVLTRIEDVDARICEIIGLDRQQFSRTVMIAQGDFLRILNAGSAERKAMFGHLFHTEIYQRAELLLKEKAAALAKAREGLAARAQIAAASAEMHADDARLETFTRARQNAAASPAALADLLAVYCKELAARIRQTRAEEKRLREAREQGEISFREGKQLNDTITALNVLRGAPELSGDHAVARERERAYLVLAEKALRIRAQEKALEAASEGVLAAQDAAKKANETLALREREVRNAKAALRLASERAQAVPAIELEIRALERALTLLETQSDAAARLEKANKALADAAIAARNAEANAADLRARYLLGQAGLLATELVLGEPCPVCGSLSHPAPAALSEHTPDKRSLEDAEAWRRQCEETRTLAVAEQQAASEAEAAARAELTAQGVLEITAETAKEIATRLEEKRKLLTTLNEVLTAAEAAEKSSTASLAAATAACDAAGTHLAAAQEAEHRATAELEERLLAADFVDREAYRAALLDEVTLEARRAALAKADEQVAHIGGKIAELENTVNGRAPADLAAIEGQRDELSRLEAAASEALAELERLLLLNERAFSTLKDVADEIDKLTEEWGAVDTLARTVGGKGVGGRERLSLESYVQRYYFKEVIVAANRRLQILTDGNFLLRCRESAADLRRVAGLDLEVLDRSTGKWRDVSTLSGGESFMASLALAVGLSDVVQSSSGNVRLDMLFIDEGFGTLDENTLSRAMELLCRLSDGKRTVGVISHVSELRERIPAKLVVTRTETGSTVRAEYGT